MTQVIERPWWLGLIRSTPDRRAGRVKIPWRSYPREFFKDIFKGTFAKGTGPRHIGHCLRQFAGITDWRQTDCVQTDVGQSRRARVLSQDGLDLQVGAIELVCGL